MPKILVLTTEPLPIPGLAATGAGMRAWGLGFGLRSAGITDVKIAFAADSMRGVATDLSAVPGVASFERGQLDDFIAAQAPDAVVFQHWGLFRELRRPLKCPVAMDLAGPHLLERQLWGSADPAADLREKLAALHRVDHAVCSGEFQRHYFIPFLIQAGWDPRASLCPVIPFSLSPDLPEGDEGRDPSAFLFSGMFLPWQDPERTLRTVVSALAEKNKGRLVFVGGPHPSGDVSQGRFDRLQEFLAAQPNVEVHRTMPFDQLLGVMRRCGAAVDLMPRNSERELAFPTRTVGYLWAGLPVIHNDYDELADPIRATKSGWTLDADDQDGLSRLIGRLVGHREDIDKRRENARALVRSHYTWDKTIAPLADWCRDPKIRGDRRPPLLSVIQAQQPTAPAPVGPTEKLGRVHYAPPTPATDVARAPWYLSPFVFALMLPACAFLMLLFAFVELARLATQPHRRQAKPKK